MKKILGLNVLIFCVVLMYAQGFGEENIIVDKNYEKTNDAVIADVDGDGLVDIITLSISDKKIFWYKNLGGSEFSTSKPVGSFLAGTVNSYSIDVADFDNDGDIDIVSNGDVIRWYKNNGSGMFTTEASFDCVNCGSNGYDITHGDLDNDGDEDVVAIFGRHHAWFKNDGNGNFGSSIILSDSSRLPRSVNVADMDGDGDLDVVGNSTFDNDVSWYRNLGNGSFSDKIILIDPFSMRTTKLADIDSDGDNDIICATSTDGEVGWLENDGVGNFSNFKTLFTFSSSSSSIINVMNFEVVDLNQDGRLDILLALPTKLVWYEQGLGLNFGAEKYLSPSYNSNVIIGADLDGDNKKDIVGVYNGLYWLKNKGNQLFTEPIIKTPNVSDPYYVFTGDFNNSGATDILSASQFDSDLSWIRNDGNNEFNTQYQYNLPGSKSTSFISNHRPLAIADLNNDGMDDILTFKRWWYSDNVGDFTSELNQLVNNGNNTFSKQTILTLPVDGLIGLKLDNVDDFGLQDMVIGIGEKEYMDTPDKLAWISGQQSHDYFEIDELYNISSFVTGQLGNDQFADIIVEGQKSEFGPIELLLYSNLDGFPISTPTVILDFPSNSFEIEDVDGDGLNDILFSTYQGIKWLKNLGFYRFSGEKNFPIAISTPSETRMYDLDGDGLKELISFANFGKSIVFCINIGNGIYSHPFEIANSSLGFSKFDFKDMNSDGLDDIIVSSSNADKIVWFENLLNYRDLVSVIVFYDENQNGIKDTEEIEMENQFVFLDSVRIPSSTRQLGYLMESGIIYTLAWEEDTSWVLTTNPSTFEIQIDLSQNRTYEFGISPIKEVTNFEINLSSGIAVCNRKVPFQIYFANEGTTIENGFLILENISGADLTNFSVSPDSIVGDILYWNFQNVFPGQSILINTSLGVPFLPGDSLVFRASLFLVDTMGSLTDTFRSVYNAPIFCAFDPNDKLVQPQGVGEKNFTLSSASLTYTVRFQNTGNFPAADVVIKDTLDEKLDISTFRILNRSHGVRTSINEDGVVSFYFPDIQLPDSTTDFLGSQGFVTYSISPIANLEDSSIIENNAFIFFDSNPEIETNTTSNTMVDQLPDFQAPEAICISNLNLYLDILGQANLEAEQINLNSTDNVGISSLVIDKTSFNCGDIGEQTVMLTVTDFSRNTDFCSASINILDTFPPSIECQNIALEIAIGDTITITAEALLTSQSENCGNISFVISQMSFSVEDEGQNEVEIIAMDNEGNEVSCFVNVEVSIVTSIINSIYGNNVTIFPNPFNNQTTFRLNQALPFSYDLKLHDVLGKAVESFYNLTQTEVIIQKQNLSTGIYFLNLYESGKNLVLGSYKLVVE